MLEASRKHELGLLPSGSSHTCSTVPSVVGAPSSHCRSRREDAFPTEAYPAAPSAAVFAPPPPPARGPEVGLEARRKGDAHDPTCLTRMATRTTES